MKSRPLLLALLLAMPLTQLPLTASAAGMTQAEKQDERAKVDEKTSDQYKRKEAAITDWKAKGLSAPEEGSQWVEIGNDYVLVNIANGVVKEVKAKK